MRYADRGHIQWKPQFVQLLQPQRYSYIRASDPYTAQQSRGRYRPRICMLFMLTRSMAHNRVRFAPSSLSTAGLSVQIYGKTKSRSGILLWLGSAVRFGTVAHVREARPDEAIKESCRIRITGARGKQAWSNWSWAGQWRSLAASRVGGHPRGGCASGQSHFTDGSLPGRLNSINGILHRRGSN
jgi:hypothetical protein